MKNLAVAVFVLSALAACAGAQRPIPPGLETGILGNGADGGGGEDVVGRGLDTGTLGRVTVP